MLILIAAFHRTKALTNGKSFEVIAELTKPSQTIIAIITSVSWFRVKYTYYTNSKQESLAGVTKQKTFKPNIPANKYPVLDTKPLSCVVSLWGCSS